MTETRERTVSYYGLTDGGASKDFLAGPVDHEGVLNVVTDRHADVASRLWRRDPDSDESDGLLGEVFTRLGDGERTLILYKVEPAGIMRLLRGETVEEYNTAGASLMSPSWVRFHPDNRLSILKGPGGAGIGDLQTYLNKLDPPLLERDAVPHAGRARTVGLTALPSQQDLQEVMEAVIPRSVDFKMPVVREVEVEGSWLSDLFESVRGRVPNALRMRVLVEVDQRDPNAHQAVQELRDEVGRLTQNPDDLRLFEAARVGYSAGTSQSNLDLLQEFVTVKVPVELAARGAFTNPNAHIALTKAWEIAEARLPSAIQTVQNGDDGCAET